MIRLFRNKINHKTVVGLLLLIAIGSGGCGGNGDDPVVPDVVDTVAEYIARGWERFEAGNIPGAQEDFTAALANDATSGPAVAGQAWALLVVADSNIEMEAAIASFNLAIAQGETETYVLAGKAAARLGTGAWTETVADAQAAITSGPGFVFEHRTSFTYVDLFLIMSTAKAASGDLDGALAAVDVVQDSGLDATIPATWIVDEVTYSTFAVAVLAFLQLLSTTYAG